MTEALWIVGQLVAGWFVADLFSALFHLTIDKLAGQYHLPVIGQMVREFEAHHQKPSLMLEISLWENSKLTCMGGLLALIVFGWWSLWFAAPCAVGVALCQGTHRWAHQGRPPALAKWLQACRLFIGPKTHNFHHGDFRRNFGILNGWSNPILNGILTAVGM